MKALDYKEACCSEFEDFEDVWRRTESTLSVAFDHKRLYSASNYRPPAMFEK